MTDESLKKSFARDIALMKLVGMNPVIIHGGGPQIGKELSKAGLESEFIGGLRVTTKSVMSVVKKILGNAGLARVAWHEALVPRNVVCARGCSITENKHKT